MYGKHDLSISILFTTHPGDESCSDHTNLSTAVSVDFTSCQWVHVHVWVWSEHMCTPVVSGDAKKTEKPHSVFTYDSVRLRERATEREREGGREEGWERREGGREGG